jgi:hypothetical protein
MSEMLHHVIRWNVAQPSTSQLSDVDVKVVALAIEQEAAMLSDDNSLRKLDQQEGTCDKTPFALSHCYVISYSLIQP